MATTLLGLLEARMLAYSQAVPSRSSSCALSFPQRPPVGQLPWIHIKVRKDPPGGLHDSGFAPREGHTCLGRSVSEDMIRSLNSSHSKGEKRCTNQAEGYSAKSRWTLLRRVVIMKGKEALKLLQAGGGWRDN